MGENAGDHFGGKVPDFKTEHKMVPNHAPVTEEIIDMDDLARVIPQFVPIQVAAQNSHEIASSASRDVRGSLERMTTMSDFQLNYLQRCIYDALHNMLMGQDTWNWQQRYEHAIARGEVPDPRKD